MARTIYFSDPPLHIIRDDSVLRDLEIAREASSNTTEIDLPEEQQVFVHDCTNRVTDNGTGITFQRCGGGRRVIRKKIGGN